MYSLKEKLEDSGQFAIGLELVSTRGTMQDLKSRVLRDFAGDVVSIDDIDWVSITDNAGGNPMLNPICLGKPLLYSGKDVIIHLSCKDLNRNGLEREAWLLASEGFHNILTLSGDYPIDGYQGKARPVFDIDSVGLLKMLDDMNQGLSITGPGGRNRRNLRATDFFPGAVATNFKLHENEVMPQYFKLAKKIECGARFIISQIGYDSQKSHELLHYMKQNGMADTPLVGNVYLLNARIAKVFHGMKIPGVVVSDELLEVCEKQAKSEDRGRRFFMELAAKQMAVFRGMGYRAVYLGGIHKTDTLREVLDTYKSYGNNDWVEFAREIRYSRPGEFYYFARDESNGLIQPEQVNPNYLASLKIRTKTRNVNFAYTMGKLTHDILFTPGKGLFRLGKRFYGSCKNIMQGPGLLRKFEHGCKVMMFDCRDCGDCSLPDITFLCPESQCAKNQRNGPCGGTRDGLCEVTDEKECIWARAYDRLKYEGREQQMLDHAPVIQDAGLIGTSSWANTYLGRDHSSRHRGARQSKE